MENNGQNISRATAKRQHHRLSIVRGWIRVK